MKKAKRIASFLLALVLALSMTITAFATDSSAQPASTSDDDATYTITINNAIEGHNYKAYQIFMGDLGADGETLSNILWGTGITEAGQLALQEKYGDEYKTASEVAAKLSEYVNNDQPNEEKTNTLAFLDEIVAGDDTNGSYLSATSVSSKFANGKYTISGLKMGYYLVKDSDDVSVDSHEDTNTRYIVGVIKNTEIIPKNGTTTSEKKVLEGQDCPKLSNADRAWQDAADYDIGDKVTFQLTATIADDYSYYEKYYLAFHDVQSEGLDFNADSVEVYISSDGSSFDKITKKSLYTVLTGDDVTCDKGCTFEVVFGDLKKLESPNGTKISAGSVVKVVYNSTLNQKAVIGGTGNPNVMHVEYSKDANDKQGGTTGNTPDDKVTVFTYELEINKVDEDGFTPLAGAGFTLFKYYDDGNSLEAVTVDETTGVVSSDDNAVAQLKDRTTFKWSGLDAGKYVLKETTTPNGYNTMGDIEFTIVSEYETASNNPTLISVEGKGSQGIAGSTQTKDFTFETLESNGLKVGLTKDIANYKGVVLPETGGTGVTVLYTVGAILVLGATILLITRRRMKMN